MDRKFRIINYNIIVSIIFLLMIWILDLKENFMLMLFYSINSTIVFGLLFWEEIRNYKGLTPNLLLLVGYILRLVYPSLEMSIGALEGEKYDFLYTNEITDFIFPTVVWMNLYYMIFYYAFVRFAKGYTLDSFIKPYFDKYHFTTIAVVIFIPGVIYEVVTNFIPVYVIPSIITTIFGGLTKLAILMQVFNTSLKYTKKKHSVLVFLVIVEMLRATFFGFYKSAIMMPFIFYMLYIFLHLKNQGKSLINRKIILLIVSFFAIITYFIYPFMEIKRIESGFSVAIGETGIATCNYSNIAIIQDVLSGKTVKDTEDLTTTGRLNAIPANAFFYREGVVKNLCTFEVAKNNAELLVPRFLNPNKHTAQAGLMTYAYATTGSFKNYKTAISNNFIGQFASAYIMGGAFMAILLAFFNGFLMIKYQDYLTNNIANPLALLLIVSQLFATLEGFEEIHDGGVLRAGLALIYMFAIYITNPYFGRRKKSILKRAL